MAKVIRAFFDSQDNEKHYKVGDVYAGDRVDYLTDLGFLEVDKPKKDYSKLKKDELQNLLTGKEIEFTQDETKAELLEKLK